MRRTVLALSLTASLAAASGIAAAQPAAGPPQESAAVGEAPGRPVPGSYIVTVRDGADPRGIARAASVSPRFVYSEALNGFAATLNPGQLNAVQRHPDTVAVEADQVVTADETQTVTATGLYGLDRIDQSALPLSGTFTYGTTAPAVTAYVIDTGIATGHPDFEGRAANVVDVFGGDGQDCNGHGTHVAGTIGGQTVGVAKDARLRGLRVLDCAGSGSTSGIIAAVDWVRANAARPAVANLSLGGGKSSALNTAVSNLSNSGVFTAVAAGNSSTDACNVSPASAPEALTVAASDRTDTRASFSNHGRCVDTYAPGVAITSTWLAGGSATISGTSMASPHAAGVAALYKGRVGDASSSTVTSWITQNATSNVVKSNPRRTVNRLLNTRGL